MKRIIPHPYPKALSDAYGDSARIAKPRGPPR